MWATLNCGCGLSLILIFKTWRVCYNCTCTCVYLQNCGCCGVTSIHMYIIQCKRMAFTTTGISCTTNTLSTRDTLYRAIVSVLEMPGQNVLPKSNMVGHFYIWSDTIQTSYVWCNQCTSRFYVCVYVCVLLFL